ncbi:MAG: cation transporter [Candidatus Liberibacter europaeus]|uniref:Cation transporter n=1 Tax=Candidatus Liberibacter europaeus TaxID=744859 RepID=A0A2T4VY08_9HYPH|nr:cation transporter [Candidatus Liberibacter europaeus]PTL86658.1 MAG: cation transporter [Candidatus Liberibacter europaeus]
MQDYKARSNLEERILKLSIAVTIIIGSMNLIIGYASGSSSIIFEGLYSYVDAVITTLSLFVVVLISRYALEVNFNRRKRYFQFGFWHLEPMIIAFNSIMLIFAILYELIKSMISIMSGGNEPAFGLVVVSSIITSLISFTMGIYENRYNRKIKSDFISVDVKAWIASGVISSSFIGAFLFGMLLKDGLYHWITHYIDPIVLVAMCLFICPSTIRAMKRSLFEIFQMTAPDFDMQVKNAIYPIVVRHGFLDFYTYVTKMGRSRIIEIHLIVPLNYPIRSIASLDLIRSEIGDAIGGFKEDRWLTISFTTQQKWAI